VTSRYASLCEALIQETRDAGADAIDAYLQAEGFGDVGGHWPFVLATFFSGTVRADPTASLPTAGSGASDMLVERGYLKRASGRELTLLTGRGSAMLVGIWQDVVRPARWAGFPFRPGDLVITTPAKSGTTWMQMICALLVLQTPDLPAPLPELSPWLDAPELPRDETYARLTCQPHRRFIKTHTPLNEMPLSPLATYITVARHPLDAAISRYHAHRRQSGRQAEREWLLGWIEGREGHRDDLPQLLGQLSEAWTRRGEPNVVLVHYDDLSADLDGEMHQLAARLGITVPDEAWPALVKAATFQQMRTAASQLAPLSPADRLSDEDNTAFFRKGTSGSGSNLLTAAELTSYHTRTAQLAPADLLTWLHRDNNR
jgi:aryl sulfotransferase